MLGLWLVLGCASTTIHERTWVEARTPHFTIWSCQDEDETLELARNLELFRSVVAFASGQELPTSPVPTHVYAFDTPYTYRPFAVRGAGGHFEQSLRENTIVLAGESTTRYDTVHIIQHEYVHYLLGNHGDFVYPAWYHEGFAEFLGSVQTRDDHVEIGGVPEGRVPTLRGWTPLEKLMGARYGDRISVMALYGQSWALVHYLIFGRDSGREMNRELTRYLRSLERGASVDEAVQQGFGVSVRELDDELRDYVRKRQYKVVRVPREDFKSGAAPELRVLGSGEVAFALGRLSLKRRRHDQARAYFRKAVVLEPNDGRARAGIGDAYAAEGRFDEAAREYALALEIAPDDAWVQLGQGNLLNQRARQTTDGGERSHLVGEARRHYVRSWKLDDSIPETYARYGTTYLLDGQETAKGLQTLEHAYRLLPSSMEVRIDLAEMKLRLGDRGGAQRLALSAAASVHEPEVRERIETLLAEARGDAL